MTYTIVVLAGGKSSRFGSNKIFFKIGGSTMLEWVLRAAFNSNANEIILSVKSAELNISKEFNSKLKIVSDEIDDYSPLVGIMSAARAASNEDIIVIPADSPLVTSNFLNLLHKYLEQINVDGVIPIWKDGKIEAIHAAYKKSEVLLASEKLISIKDYRVRALARVLKKVYFLSSSDLEYRDRLSLIDFDNPAEILDYFKPN